jgi:NodT family efflux transporter outer membrane factor (OMF) lipoprotein
VSYNFDVFGGNRRVLESLASRTEFQKFQLEGAQLTLAANIVTTAVTQAKLASQIRANQESLTAQDEQLVVARHRLRLGQASEDDVLALTAEAEQTRAGIPVLETRHKQMTHLLATLSGEAPGEVLTLSFALKDFTIPTNLPLVVPSLLVRNRPDIQAAEALMRAANADYGAAIARMYPQLNLSSSIGSLALGPETLFGTGSLFWQVLGQLTQPIFNAGLPAESRAALAAFDASASNYQTVVLDALRNVADVLRALENDARTLESQSKANAAATALAKSVERQYALGSASYLQLLIAQLQAQRTKFELIAAQAQRLSDTAALFQSMGGGRLNNESVK